MTDAIFSPAARRDLKSILEFISRDNPSAAVNFVTKIKAQCRTLISFPRMGARRPQIKEGLRGVPIGSYVIYYSLLDEGVRIERILHGAQDSDAYFESV